MSLVLTEETKSKEDFRGEVDVNLDVAEHDLKNFFIAGEEVMAKELAMAVVVGMAAQEG